MKRKDWCSKTRKSGAYTKPRSVTSPFILKLVLFLDSGDITWGISSNFIQLWSHKILFFTYAVETLRYLRTNKQRHYQLKVLKWPKVKNTPLWVSCYHLLLFWDCYYWCINVKIVFRWCNWSFIINNDSFLKAGRMGGSCHLFVDFFVVSREGKPNPQA